MGFLPIANYSKLEYVLLMLFGPSKRASGKAAPFIYCEWPRVRHKGLLGTTKVTIVSF